MEAMMTLDDIPSSLKVRVASYLTSTEAFRLSLTSKQMYEDLAFAQIPMRIPFKSWYDEPLPLESTARHPKRGPKIPFLSHRTHSVTLTGSWSCRLGELQGRHYGANSQAQFYIVAYPLDQFEPSIQFESERSEMRLSKASNRGNFKQEESGNSWLDDGGRIVWASRPLCQRHYHQSSNSSWVKLTATFVPSQDEEYYLSIKPGPGTASQRQWWRHSLHMSNLIAHIHYHDNPHTNFLLKRQYKTIVKHMLQVENRGAYYTKILEAVARSIRIQLARFGRNALDPVLESFFLSTNIPRDTDSLLVLEEIARFLSYYAYVNERRKRFNNSCTERDSAKAGSCSNRDSVPDWVPYAESSVANRSSHDCSSHNHSEYADMTGSGGLDEKVMDNFSPATSVIAKAPRLISSICRRDEQSLASPAVAQLASIDGTINNNNNNGPSRRRFKRAVKNLWKLPSSLFHSSGGNGKKNLFRSSHWRTDEITEEFSISVVPPEESTMGSVPPLD